MWQSLHQTTGSSGMPAYMHGGAGVCRQLHLGEASF